MRHLTEEAIRNELEGKFFTINQKQTPPQADDLSEGVKLVDGAPTLRSVMNVVSSVYGVGVLDILSPRRSPHICDARQAFYWLCRRYTARSFPEIGLFCNRRDHTTILHGVKQVNLRFPKHSARIRKCCEIIEGRMRGAE